MIKELIATIGIISTMGTNPPLKANDGKYYQDVEITETYEYETNEVNSVDDLVVGNIYHFELTNYQINANEYFRIVHKGCYNIVYDEELPIIGTTQNAPILNISNGLFIYTLTDTFISSSYPGFRTSQQYLELDFKCDFVYQLMDINQGNFIQYINASDYLGEKTITITPHETEGLYNLGYHFLVTRIYTNGELANMNVSIFGTTLNINQWLAHTTALAVTIMLLIVLIKFVIWLFKIVSGTFIWR